MNEPTVDAPTQARPERLEAAIAAAEAEVKRLERAILDSTSEDEADLARRALTRAELELWDLLDQKSDCGSCEGWPRGK